MLKEIKNNVYHAEFVVADEDGQRYIVPPPGILTKHYKKTQAPGQTPRGFSVSCKCEQAIYF